MANKTNKTNKNANASVKHGVNYTSNDYLTYVKSLVIDKDTQKALNNNYKTSNKNDSINKLATRFIDKIKSKKIDNDTLDTTFNYFIDILVVNDNDKLKLKNIDKFTLKTQLFNIYNKCMTIGVIRSVSDSQVTFSYGEKHKTALSCLKDMFKMLLANKKIFNKPPKKQKTKKTIKK